VKFHFHRKPTNRFIEITMVSIKRCERRVIMDINPQSSDRNYIDNKVTPQNSTLSSTCTNIFWGKHHILCAENSGGKTKRQI
jgi:hypothetical protein